MNLSRLTEIKTILEQAYGSSCFVYRPFKIEGDAEKGYRLTFSCDCYFDPIFSMFVLQKYGVLKLKIEWGGSETDRVVISDGDVETLKKIPLKTKGADSLAVFLAAMGCKEIAKEPETGPVIIDELDHVYSVSRERWNAYWASKGLTGPDSAWKMPTYAQICAATPQYEN